MSRYRDRYDDRSYYDDDGYSYGESYGGDSYDASYRSHRSRGSRRGGGGGGGVRRRRDDYNKNTRPSYKARIYPQDAARQYAGAGGGGGVVAYADDDNYDMNDPEIQMMPLNNNTLKNNKLVDFDSYTSDAEKLSAILKVADVEMHKHALTSEYYTLRKYSILLPIIILSLFVAMVGFVAASDIVTSTNTPRVHDSTMQEFLTLLVASCGFIVLLLTLLGNQLDYNSKIKFHNGAQNDLASLSEKMRMYRVERAMDERLVEEEMEEVRRREMEMGELDLGDTESEESSVDDEEEEDDMLLLDVEQGGGGMGGLDNAWDNVVQMNTGEYPSGAIVARQDGSGAVLANISAKKQAAMERKIARQAKKQLKLSKRLEKKNEYLTKELVNQKITQERQQQEMSKDIITFYGYHAELHQIISGCKSDVPPQISKFFNVMENRVELMSLSRLGIQEESRMRKNQIIRLCANEIYNEIQGFVMWPVMVPPVDSTIEASLRTVGQLLNMNYRPQMRCKLFPCCTVTLCCKKNKSNNIFSVINEGIDQRELDMMQAERVEVLRQVNERKARLMAGPAEVLELKDEESVKVPIMSKKPKDPMPWMITQNTVQQQMKDYADFGDGYSRATIDPDGSVMDEMMTEDSDPRVVRKGEGGMNSLGLYVHDEDDDAEEDGTDGDGTGGGTFQGIAPAAPKSEVYSQVYSQSQDQGYEQEEKKKAKAEKEAKKKAKAEKKAKKKAKAEKKAKKKAKAEKKAKKEEKKKKHKKKKNKVST